MDSHLASVLTRGSLEVQDGSRHAERSEPVTEAALEPKETASTPAAPGNLQPCPVKATVTISRDAQSINGKKPEVGGTSEPASQEVRKIGGSGRPITVRTAVPVLHSRPIRLKIVVPPRCERPITNSATSLTKDSPSPHVRGPVSESSRATAAEHNLSKVQISAVKSGGEIKEIASHETEDVKNETFHKAEAETGENMGGEKDNLSAQIHANGLETSLISTPYAFKTLAERATKEETAERRIGVKIPQFFRDMQPSEIFNKVGVEEQTEPLDLSLPKRRESRERRCGRFLDDSGCESLLIMEVDEYEGEGDRDIVEEDDDEGDEEDRVLRVDDTLEDSPLSPSFFSTSVFSSLSLIEGDTENLLLIDDQGIPYTLSPEGLKVPQVDASMAEGPPPESAEAEAGGSPRPVSSSADPNVSQSSDNALSAPADDVCATDPPPLADETKAPDVSTGLIANLDPSKAAEPCVQPVQASALLSPSSGIAVPSQPIQILANPSANAPILLLSSSSSSPPLSSAPMGLTLPLSVPQAAASSSVPMFLLLSSVPSSSSDSASTSTPIAVLDPSTGHLSQITTASSSLPLPPAQVSSLGSPLPAMSHPIIRLGPNNPPVILPGVKNATSGSVLTSFVTSSSSPALQNDKGAAAPLQHSQINSPEPVSESKAIAEAEEVSSENDKPSTSTASSLQPQSSASATFDQLAQADPEARSPASEPRFDSSDLHTQHLPLDDHLYFSNPTAPRSPPIAPILSSGKLKPLDPEDPLDPLSPVASPNNLGPRRVLYCQLCPRVFFYLSDLERHAITHSQKKPHVCQQCGKAFKRSSHLQVSASSLEPSFHQREALTQVTKTDGIVFLVQPLKTIPRFYHLVGF